MCVINSKQIEPGEKLFDTFIFRVWVGFDGLKSRPGRDRKSFPQLETPLATAAIDDHWSFSPSIKRVPINDIVLGFQQRDDHYSTGQQNTCVSRASFTVAIRDVITVAMR